jgi:hypothetical protein
MNATSRLNAYGRNVQRLKTGSERLFGGNDVGNRSFLLILIVLGFLFLQGCTVGWLVMRPEKEMVTPVAWNCPVNVVIKYSGGNERRNGELQEYDIVKSKKKEDAFRRTTFELLKKYKCNAVEGSRITSGEQLEIDVEERQFIYAVDVEYLTGLSFGIIPSISTRPAELRFRFRQGGRDSTYVVDEKRFNHLIATPVFWLTFLLENEQGRFEEALEEFMKGRK